MAPDATGRTVAREPVFIARVHPCSRRNSVALEGGSAQGRNGDRWVLSVRTTWHGVWHTDRCMVFGLSRHGAFDRFGIRSATTIASLWSRRMGIQSPG